MKGNILKQLWQEEINSWKRGLEEQKKSKTETIGDLGIILEQEIHNRNSNYKKLVENLRQEAYSIEVAFEKRRLLVKEMGLTEEYQEQVSPIDLDHKKTIYFEELSIEKAHDSLEEEDVPIILHSMAQDKDEGSIKHFFVSLSINDLVLHNCMIDTGSSANVMPLSVMKQLGLNISRPYGNVCGMDSRKIRVHGLIKKIMSSSMAMLLCSYFPLCLCFISFFL